MNYIGGFNYFLLTVNYQLGGGIRIFHYDQFENIQVIYSDLKNCSISICISMYKTVWGILEYILRH